MADNDNVIPFLRPDGSRTFVCEDCGWTVHVFADFEGGDFNVCRTCQFIGEHPQLPEHWKAILRGDAK